MNKIIITFTLLLMSFVGFGQSAFKSGEYFKFQVSYGFINAGIATLELKDATYNGKSVFHAKGYGYTTGVSKTFFKVKDDYQSYFDKSTGQPYRFVRKIQEGGYNRNQEGFIDYKSNTVLLKDHKTNTERTFNVHSKIQDVISSFYHLRNHEKLGSMKVGETLQIDMFFDDEIFKFKLKFMGYEKIKTKFGTVNTMKFRPYVQSGRVFKEQESLTMWVSNDENRVPIKIQASLLVGSLKAELIQYKNLKTPLKVVK
ncbi:DUF3108 domain-containing protein [Flavobacterium sp. xlx-214]|uniref:DUF3108 domain-containing protein n=1 Tax=unclassified Flavobacterium TaxID=196869 RepID=UPI0013D5C811|nr:MULTISPECIES: DUF3108 domain-containing protein [unclassified Flavobacterium]MBA5792226.1 DUF3108 domain-containing protein [Flavobacterium sp. xlx-221]QMI84468.1 DUF3108 domain-containing protein [Flavobacterium sp. xlx-214]